MLSGSSWLIQGIIIIRNNFKSPTNWNKIINNIRFNTIIALLILESPITFFRNLEVFKICFIVYINTLLIH